MNLLEKIQAVAMGVMTIEKDMTVGKGNYAYKAVSDLSVTLKVKELEKEYGIISIPFKQELVKSEVIKAAQDDGREKVAYSVFIKMTTRIFDIADETKFIDIESFGHGLDSGDKGFGKASTYARKYALLNAYKIATGEDPDKDASQPEITRKTISEKRIAVNDYFGKNVTKIQDILKYFNAPCLEDLTEKDIESIYKSYTERKLL